MQTWVIVYAIAAAQAVLLASALWRRPANAAANRTILDIAYACGFTSKSTFNAAFKRQLAGCARRR